MHRAGQMQHIGSTSQAPVEREHNASKCILHRVLRCSGLPAATATWLGSNPVHNQQRTTTRIYIGFVRCGECSSKVVPSSIEYRFVNRERPVTKLRNETWFVLRYAQGVQLLHRLESLD